MAPSSSTIETGDERAPVLVRLRGFDYSAIDDTKVTDCPRYEACLDDAVRAMTSRVPRGRVCYAQDNKVAWTCGVACPWVARVRAARSQLVLRRQVHTAWTRLPLQALEDVL